MLRVLSVNSLEYEIAFELDELTQYAEGLYMAVLKLDSLATANVVSAVERNPVIAGDSLFSQIHWHRTPASGLRDGTFAYSPVTSATQEQIDSLASSLATSGNLFCYYERVSNPGDFSVYLIDKQQNRIVIFHLYS